MSICDKPYQPSVPLCERLKRTTPPCGECANYLPSIHGMRCCHMDCPRAEVIEQTDSGTCLGFVYRSQRLGK